MSFGFKNIGHFFATVAGDIVKGARAVGSVMVKVGKAEPEVEAITSLFFPQAVALERGAFALLGMAAHVVSETGDAAAANGLNITLDAQLVADIKALIQRLSSTRSRWGRRSRQSRGYEGCWRMPCGGAGSPGGAGVLLRSG